MNQPLATIRNLRVILGGRLVEEQELRLRLQCQAQ